MPGDDGIDEVAPPQEPVDDDPTVFADEDLIRQIRIAGQQATPDVPAPGDGDDETVHVDDSVIAEIRAARHPADTGPNEPPDPENDPTVFADEDLIRQIRVAASVEAAPKRDTDPAPGMLEVATDVPEDDHTVVAGEQIIRELRVAGIAPPPSAAQHVGPGEPVMSDDIEQSVEMSVPSLVPDDAAAALEELRKRFAPEEKRPRGSVVPIWVLMAGIGLLVVLVVVVLAVVFVG